MGIAGALATDVTVGNLSEMPDRIVVTSSPRSEVEINAIRESKTISGNLSGWKLGEPRAYVLARNELNGDVQTTETDQNGRFSFSGLAPGEYDLFAWTSLEGIAFSTRGGLRPYERNKVTVSTDDSLSAGNVVVPLAAEDTD